MTNPFEIIEARLGNIETLLLDLKYPPTTPTKPDDEVLYIADLERLTGYKKGYLFKMVHERTIPFHKPNNGKLFFLRSEIMVWIKAGRRATRQEISEAVNG